MANIGFDEKTLFAISCHLQHHDAAGDEQAAAAGESSGESLPKVELLRLNDSHGGLFVQTWLDNRLALVIQVPLALLSDAEEMRRISILANELLAPSLRQTQQHALLSPSVHHTIVQFDNNTNSLLCQRPSTQFIRNASMSHNQFGNDPSLSLLILRTYYAALYSHTHLGVETHYQGNIGFQLNHDNFLIRVDEVLNK